jgi:hypothetical protein
MEKDFSFNNPEIKKYFEGDDSCAPVRELIYLHTHPLVQPNFLIEINNLVLVSTDKLVARNATKASKAVQGLEDLCIKLGQSLPEDEVTAENALIYLRDLYNLCNEINKG